MEYSEVVVLKRQTIQCPEETGGGGGGGGEQDKTIQKTKD